MGSRGKLLFDLNEPPTEDEEETKHVICLQPQKALPSVNPNGSNLFPASVGPETTKNNKGFSHASLVPVFQPFVHPKDASFPESGSEKKIGGDHQNSIKSLPKESINGNHTEHAASFASGFANTGAEEREEGEWSDIEGSTDASASSGVHELGKASQEHGMPDSVECSASGMASENISGSTNITDNMLVENNGHVQDLDQRLNDKESTGNKISNFNSHTNGDASMGSLEEDGSTLKAREIKGVEANHALKIANNMGKRKIDQHKEAMLGKKRNRQTMLINIDEVKQAGAIKSSTPRKPPTIVRTVKEVRTITPPSEHGEKNANPMVKDQKKVDSFNEGSTSSEPCQQKGECKGDICFRQPSRTRRRNSDTDFPADGQLKSIPRHNSWKQPTDSKMGKSSQFSGRKPALMRRNSVDSKLGNKKHPPAKKPAATSTQYQDTSVERLIREMTSDQAPENRDMHLESGSKIQWKKAQISGYAPGIEIRHTIRRR